MPKSPSDHDQELAFWAAKRVFVKQRYKRKQAENRREYKTAIERIGRAERAAWNGLDGQLERLAQHESRVSSTSARETVVTMLLKQESSNDTAALKRFRRIWEAPETDEERAVTAKMFDPFCWKTWPAIAQECGIPFPVIFNKSDVADVLGYSLTGVDKLRKKGFLPSQNLWS